MDIPSFGIPYSGAFTPSTSYHMSIVPIIEGGNIVKENNIGGSVI